MIVDNEDVMDRISLWLDMLSYQVMTTNTGLKRILIV